MDEPLARKIKALVVDDPSVSGSVGRTCELILKHVGHSAQFINAPLIYDDDGRTSYAPEMVQHILSIARELEPDWVVMVLQGSDSFQTVQVAIDIHEQTPAARFYFISGYPHTEEQDYARSCRLNLHFEFMASNPQEFLRVIESPL